MTRTSQEVRLLNRPIGRPDSSTWEITESAIPPLGDGQVLIGVQHVSIDPAMRGWLNDVRSYVPPVQVGEVMRAQGVGTVLESRTDDLGVGESVTGMFGVTDLAVTDPSTVTRIDTSIADGPTWLGALGMPGMTAYFGLLDVGRLTPGDTVVVSAAAGAVGSMVGQIAKAHGARTIGIAGGPEKCAWLVDELGFDAAVDYKNERVLASLRKLAPEGVDIYFDNVGGETLDAALANLRRGARVVVCGAISTYNETSLPPGPSRYMSLLVFRASMTGFVVFDYEDRYDEAQRAIATWLEEGAVSARTHVAEGGVAGFPQALDMLFDGRNTGKLVLEIARRPY
ncbi:NADP-dependent oxidoreductase [Aeromicrobium halocynthiae]|uniref:NADP-dependent oxidoreductase n=1 Tax=Aeromicrobium halocynthiae TaxID=560557 RepID=A0ABN2VV25_9ACTN